MLSGAAGAALLTHARPAWSAWGDAPEEAKSLLLPTGVKAERCLEIFLYGGLSPFESFYCVPEYGTSSDREYSNQQWHCFAEDHANVFGGRSGVDPDAYLSPWRADAAGMTVNLGPLVMPFRNRPDILDRMRVVVLSHDLERHETAIPYSLAGTRLGNPRMAGTGAHIMRYFQERDTTGRVIPYSVVLTPDGAFFTDNLQAADAAGLHPGCARPLRIQVGDTFALRDRLARSPVGDSRGDIDALAEAFKPDGLAPSFGSALGESTSDVTGMSIQAAVQLLKHAIAPARYVQVVDGGLISADGGGAFDSHLSHLATQARNCTHTLAQLADRINAPGEGDPAKLDLDDTVIYLASEFGRTPYRQGPEGTGHHPYGYVGVLIGGPIGPDQAGIVGAIGPDGRAIASVNPAEMRVALLAAMGIYPFAHESFAVGDVRGATSEAEALAWATEAILGRAS